MAHRSTSFRVPVASLLARACASPRLVLLLGVPACVAPVPAPAPVGSVAAPAHPDPAATVAATTAAAHPALPSATANDGLRFLLANPGALESLQRRAHASGGLHVMIQLERPSHPINQDPVERRIDVRTLQGLFMKDLAAFGFTDRDIPPQGSRRPRFLPAVFLDLNEQALDKLSLFSIAAARELSASDEIVFTVSWLPPLQPMMHAPASIGAVPVDDLLMLQGLDEGTLNPDPQSVPVIALLDTGVQFELPAFKDRFVGAFYPLEDSSTSANAVAQGVGVISELARAPAARCDVSNLRLCHGTKTAWLAARAAPECKLIGVRVDNPAADSSKPSIDAGTILAALADLRWSWIDMLAAQDPKMELAAVSMSLAWAVADGNPTYDCAFGEPGCEIAEDLVDTYKLFDAQVQELASKNVAVVVPAGNDDLPRSDAANAYFGTTVTGSITFPGCIASALCASGSAPSGALTSSGLAAFDTRAFPCNWSRLVDAIAPATDMEALDEYYPGSGLQYVKLGAGTSLSVPQVAAAVARLRGWNYPLKDIVDALSISGNTVLYSGVWLPSMNVGTALVVLQKTSSTLP